MVIVITGGAGFLGMALAEQLAGSHTLYLIDTNPQPTWFAAQNVHFIRADVGEFADFFECDLLIHAASPVGPVGILNAGGDIGYRIVQTTRQVLRWALARRSKLIFISTSEVYGHGGLLSEDTECVFRGPDPSIRNEYAQAKLLAEIMVSNTAKLNPTLAYQIIRPFNIAGPRQLPEKGFVLPRFAIQALAGRALTVYGTGAQRRAFTHVRDIAQGIMTVAEAGAEHYNNVWNLGNPENHISMRDLAEMVCRAAGKGVIENYDPQELHGPWFTECAEKLPDITRAATRLGWRPAITLDGIVAEVVAFWKEGDRYLGYLDVV